MSIGSLSLQRTSGKRVAKPIAASGFTHPAQANGSADKAIAYDGAAPRDILPEAPLRQPVNMVRPPKEVQDHELLQQFTKGNEEAYVELYLRRQAEVYTFCLRLAGGDRDLASDLFQETFIKVFRKAHTFREGTNVLGWLYTIVRTTYLNHKRKRTLVGIDDTHEELQSTDRSMHPEYREEQATLKERVERAIANLPVEIREPFILREFDGFSYQEISEQLQITLGGVRQRIYRAKLAMREELWDLVHDTPNSGAASNNFDVEDTD